MKIINFAIVFVLVLIGAGSVCADPAPTFYYPGPGLDVPLADTLQPHRYGVVLSNTGTTPLPCRCQIIRIGCSQ